MENELQYTGDPWQSLKAFTAARIALGRAGNSVPLKKSLEFQLAHAHARDAVYSTLDKEMLTEELKQFGLPVIAIHSKAENRQQYLQRPDFGRQLNKSSAAVIEENAFDADISIVLADGLSANAINANAIELLRALIPLLQSATVSFAPVCLAEQARVALGDPVSYGLKAKLSIVLIGERPGLSAADSIGSYITWQPRPGLTDETRNCVSNIRPMGLIAADAAQKIFYLVGEAFRRKLSGIHLKDNSGLLE